MTRLLLCDVTSLENPELFGALYDNASSRRREIADSFRFARDRILSIGAAALLDAGLRCYGLREKDMSYGSTCCGKPFFPDAPGIHFNISHSSSKVAVAFSDSEVGCDIEEMTSPDLDVAKRFFSRDEYEDVISREDPEWRSREFFRIWTLKESYLKATGTGLSVPPESFSVSESLGGFSLKSPFSFDGYACALCCRPEAESPRVGYINLQDLTL